MGAIWGSLAAICIGGSDLFGRRIVNVSGAITAAATMQMVGMLAAIATLVVVEGTFSWGDMGWGALSGLGLAGGLGLYYTGLTNSSSTVVSPIVATLAAIIPFVYSLVRGSDASTLAIVGAAVSFIGLAIIAAGVAEVTRLRAGILWGVLSGTSYGVGISVLIEASSTAGAWPAVAQRACGTIVLVSAALVARSAVWPPPGQRLNGLAAGTLAGLTSVFALIGLRIDAPLTVVTQSMFPVVSVFVGFLYFGDRVVRRQVMGLVLVLLGIAAVVGS